MPLTLSRQDTDHRVFASHPCLVRFKAAPAPLFHPSCVPYGLVEGAWWFTLPNGFQVSVARGDCLKGSERGLFEALVYVPGGAHQAWDCFLGAGPHGCLTAGDVATLLGFVAAFGPDQQLPAHLEARAETWIEGVIEREYA